jgi:hypothetical protein
MTPEKTAKKTKPITAEAIARLADRGKDISRYFSGRGRMIHPTPPAKKPKGPS